MVVSKFGSIKIKTLKSKSKSKSTKKSKSGSKSSGSATVRKNYNIEGMKLIDYLLTIIKNDYTTIFNKYKQQKVSEPWFTLLTQLSDKYFPIVYKSSLSILQVLRDYNYNVTRSNYSSIEKEIEKKSLLDHNPTIPQFKHTFIKQVYYILNNIQNVEKKKNVAVVLFVST